MTEYRLINKEKHSSMSFNSAVHRLLNKHFGDLRKALNIFCFDHDRKMDEFEKVNFVGSLKIKTIVFERVDECEYCEPTTIQEEFEQIRANLNREIKVIIDDSS